MAEEDDQIALVFKPRGRRSASVSEDMVAALHLLELSGDHSGEGSNNNYMNYNNNNSSEEMISPEPIEEVIKEEEEEEALLKDMLWRPKKRKYRTIADLYKSTKPVKSKPFSLRVSRNKTTTN